MSENKPIRVTFPTPIPKTTEGIIKFLYGITKDSVNTVEQMQQANDDYYAAINKVKDSSPASEKQKV